MQSLDDWRVPDHIANDYQLLIKRWQELKTVLEGEQPQRYLPLVASFVKQIDDFVLKLQIFSEQKITKLTVVGGLGLGGIVLASIYVVLYVRREIVYPLRELAIASERIQNRSFDVELSHESKTEMGVLTRTFSNMAKDLGKLYRGLEQAVDEKTQELQKANTSLHVLYRSSQELADARINIDNFQAILRHIVSIDSIGKVQLDIDDDDSSVSLCEGEAEQAEVIHRELYLDGEHLGSLHFYCIQEAPEHTLLDNFAQILARAIFYNQAQRQAEQLLLAEERATIARELHDSLAQSLSYLKIQVALFKKQMTKLEMSSGAANTVAELDTGLSDAYTQLRELLTTFRLTIKEGNFGVALKEMLSQLDDQTSAMIVLENGLSSVELDAHQQVHLLQLIREATINAMKHADAGRIQVSCSEEQGEIVVSVTDNGTGFSDGEAKINHYGMSIMRERAERLNGQLTVNSQHDSGTEVRLVFSLGTS
jgi:two-component system nitrate/nitrite sensor histidine kinase NarQ